MKCEKFQEDFLFRFVDNELGQELLVHFRRHVADCPHCAQQARYTRRLLMIVRERAGRSKAPSRLRARILARLPHRSFQ